MATAIPVKICSVLATPQDDVTLPLPHPQDWEVAGAILSQETARVATPTSPGSLALAVAQPATVHLAGRDLLPIEGGGSYLLAAQVFALEETPVRIGAGLYDVDGTLRTTRWQALAPQRALTWRRVHRHLEPGPTVNAFQPLIEIHARHAGGFWVDDVRLTRIAHQFPKTTDSPRSSLLRQLTATAIGADATLTLSLVESGAVPDLRHRLLSEVEVAAGRSLVMDLNQVAGRGDYLVAASQGAPVAFSISGVEVT